MTHAEYERVIAQNLLDHMEEWNESIGWFKKDLEEKYTDVDMNELCDIAYTEFNLECDTYYDDWYHDECVTGYLWGYMYLCDFDNYEEANERAMEEFRGEGLTYEEFVTMGNLNRELKAKCKAILKGEQ